MIPNNQPGHHTEVISREHYETHEGKAYMICQVDDDLDTGSFLTIAFKTPDSTDKIHLIYAANTSKECIIDFLKAPTITVDTGSDVTAYNRNDSSSNTSGILTIETTPEAGKATYNPTITDDGTNLCHERLGAGKATGGETRDIGEWILNPDTIYAIRITPTINDTIAQLKLTWYECDVV